MVIYNPQNYLPNLYTKLGDDCVYKLLKNGMCHYNIEEIHDELLKMKIVSIDDLIDKLYLKIKLPVQKKSTIIKNVIDVNMRQYKKLEPLNFSIKFPSSVAKGLKLKRSKMNHTLMDVKKRSIVIYFRGPWRTLGNTCGTDVFQCSILYKIIEKLIEDRRFILFNDVVIVSSDPMTEQFHAFKELSLKTNNWTGDEFITRTCLFSNTIHFNGGELPDLFSHTMPILSTYMANVNNITSKNHACSYEVANVIFPEIEYLTTGEKIYSKDDECSINGSLCSWSDLMKNHNFLEIYKTIKNQSICGFIDEMIDSICRLEKKVISNL